MYVYLFVCTTYLVLCTSQVTMYPVPVKHVSKLPCVCIDTCRISSILRSVEIQVQNLIYFQIFMTRMFEEITTCVPFKKRQSICTLYIHSKGVLCTPYKCRVNFLRVSCYSLGCCFGLKKPKISFEFPALVHTLSCSVQRHPRPHVPVIRVQKRGAGWMSLRRRKKKKKRKRKRKRKRKIPGCL